MWELIFFSEINFALVCLKFVDIFLTSSMYFLTLATLVLKNTLKKCRKSLKCQKFPHKAK